MNIPETITFVTRYLRGKFAEGGHKHDASDITSGALPVANGGTGGTTAALARTNLSVPSTTDLANIESSIAAVEQTTATTNHAAGDYFMLGNVLMKATAAIATGEQITTSNATPATVQGQIDTLRDSVSLKTKDVSGTTSALGSFSLGLYYPDVRHVMPDIRVVATLDYCAIPFLWNNSWYALVLQLDGQATVVTGKSATIRVHYY